MDFGGGTEVKAKKLKIDATNYGLFVFVGFHIHSCVVCAAKKQKAASPAPGSTLAALSSATSAAKPQKLTFDTDDVNTALCEIAKEHILAVLQKRGRTPIATPSTNTSTSAQTVVASAFGAASGSSTESA